jgi:hypothetical protein
LIALQKMFSLLEPLRCFTKNFHEKRKVELLFIF